MRKFRLCPRAHCEKCPHFNNRLPAAEPREVHFKGLVAGVSVVAMESQGLGAVLDPAQIACVRSGVDPFVAPAHVVKPGFEDLDEIEDLEMLTMALLDNAVEPVCDCARRLLDAVAEAPWPGPAIAARPARVEEAPLLTPMKVKAPGCRKPAPVNIFQAFEEAWGPVAVAPKLLEDARAGERQEAGAEERDRLRGLPGLAGAVQRMVWGDSDDDLDQMIELEVS